MNLTSIFRSFRLLVTVSTAIFALAASQSASAVTFKQESLLSSGNWIRVKVTEDGIQQISHEQLRALGINPENATVYGVGSTAFIDNSFTDAMPDDLVPTYSENTPDGRLIFYGEGPKSYSITFNGSIYAFSRKMNVYSNYTNYFITDSRPAAQVSTRPSASSLKSFNTHVSVNYVENETQNSFSVGAFMWDDVLKSAGVKKTLQIKDFANAGTPAGTDFDRTTINSATLFVAFMAKVNSIFTVKPSLPEGWEESGSTINNSIFAFTTKTVLGNGSYSLGMNTTLPDENLADYSFDFTAIPSPSSGIRDGVAAIDYTALIYSRHNILPENRQLVMHYAAGTKGENVRIKGNGGSIHVWNITDLEDVYPYAVSTLNSSGDVEFTMDKDVVAGAPASRYIAFDSSAELISPEVAGVVPNQNIHATNVPDLLIITTEALLPQARELAQYHRDYMNQDVEVFTQQQVFNEFSSGTPTAMAYRRLAKMLYDRNPSKFRNLLLYGPGLWDNRHLLTDVNIETLITYQTEDVGDLNYATAYVTDSYYGMLADDFKVNNIMFEPLHIGVGRIPASSSADAHSVNNKILRYLTNPLPAEAAQRVLMLSDKGDDSEHFRQSEESCSLLLENRPELTLIKGHLAGFNENNYTEKVTDMVKDALISGVSLFAYCGHGNQDAFSIWNKNINSATSFAHPPLTMLSTCDPFCFHHLANSIAERMLYKEDGGAIGIIGAMCSVYLPYNQVYTLSVLNAWSTAKPGDTYGDVLVNAKRYMIEKYRNTVSSPSSTFTNALCYNYCGDPALGVPATSYGIKVEKINGEPAKESMAVYSRVPVTVEGVVTNADGSVNKDFNGTASILLYEAPYIASTRDISSQVVMPYSDDRSLLARSAATVKNGRFQTTILAPNPQIADAQNRLVMVAENEQKQSAAGLYAGLKVEIPESTTPGQESYPAPTITNLYFNSPEYCSGSLIPANSTLIVKIDAPAGLNFATSNLGYTVRAILDGSQPVNSSLIRIEASDDNTYTAYIALNNLTAGRHDVSVSVADNTLQRADASAVFTVGDVASATLTIDEDALPARESLVFNLETDNQTQPLHKLVIQNKAKETVFSADVAFPYQWNLTDSEGEPVAEGFYEAYVICSGVPAASTAKVPVVVIR